ncbi:hypothetical protein [Haloarcula onubensis]|uniref:Uncharacterized protein n=1 Tax=Haloarcula onubensis TaxID=2950539 RepID=A0ABU2FVC1_9EURY|nr:hypothetical protein [Halomicroarcula sp. S3CR25-11]MDS0284723.1 hypothetical protein [Halomicroarcula sp. S3CR25-11]
MSKKTRGARDAVMGLMIALASFAYQQFVNGNTEVAAVTAVVVVLLFGVFREADARTIEYFAGPDAEELKPLLRRLGRWLRRIIVRYRAR